MTPDDIDIIIKKAENITRIVNYMHSQTQYVPDGIGQYNGIFETQCGLILDYGSALGIRCHFPNDNISFYLSSPSGIYYVGDYGRIRFSTGHSGYRYHAHMGDTQYDFIEYINNFSEEYIFQLLTIYDRRLVDSLILLSALNKDCKSFYGEVSTILHLYEVVKEHI